MRGKVVGVVAMIDRDDGVQGVNFAIGDDTVQSFLTSSAAPVGANAATDDGYRGDPRDIAITADDLPSDWAQVDDDASQVDAGRYVQTFEMQSDARGDLLEVVIVVEDSADSATADFQHAIRQPSRGMRRTQAPAIGDASYAETSGRSILMMARTNNVIVLVARGGSADQDLPVALLNVVIGRASGRG
jgi:hypothetical protein